MCVLLRAAAGFAFPQDKVVLTALSTSLALAQSLTQY